MCDAPGVITPLVIDGRVFIHIHHDDVQCLLAADEDVGGHRLTEVATEAASAATTYAKLFHPDSRLEADREPVATDGGDVDAE
jgi:hypothetical protein